MLAILSTHPIQYQVPLWQALARDGKVPFEVWYLSNHAATQSFDSEFKRAFAWDLNMLEGYPFQFLETNTNPDVARFTKLRLLAPLSEQLRKKRVKALWIQGWQVAAYWQAAWQAYAARIPVWLRGESNDLAQVALWKRPIKRLAMRELFTRITHFLYIGQANRRFYKKFGVRDEQLRPAYYCVDNHRFMNVAEELRPERFKIRREWGIPEDKFCVLFAGKFIAKKRPLDLVRAATNLGKSGHEPHLLFVGSGELGGQIRGACNIVFDAESGCAPKPVAAAVNGGRPTASFTGFLNQTEISKAYVAADCLVLPSDHRETWGLVVNEAMASGLPCLVSNSCGCAEDLVAPINSDYCFPSGDIGAMSDVLEKILHDNVEPSRFKSHIDKFCFDVSIDTVKNLYYSLEEA